MNDGRGNHSPLFLCLRLDLSAQLPFTASQGKFPPRVLVSSSVHYGLCIRPLFNRSHSELEKRNDTVISTELSQRYSAHTSPFPFKVVPETNRTFQKEKKRKNQ